MNQMAEMTCVLCPGDHQVEVATTAIEQPGPGEMRVRTMASAICGSDLHHYRTSQRVRSERGWSQYAIGHESSGIVDAVGPGVHYPSEGDRVVVFGLLGCGHCNHCRRGEPMFCKEARHFSRHQHGTDAAYLVAPARNALLLPDDFSFEMGVLLSCNVGTAYGALRKAKPSGDRILGVFGLGPVGLACVLLGKAHGASVVGIDPSADRRNLALHLGGDAAVDSAASDLIEQLVAFSGGDGLHATIDTSGQPSARGAAIDALRVHGTCIEVGVGHDPSITPSEQILFKEITIRGSWLYKQYEWESLVEFVRRHPIPIENLITHRFRPEDAAEAFELANTATSGKILFDWSQE